MNAKAPPYDGAGLWVESANFPVQKLKPLKVMIKFEEIKSRPWFKLASVTVSTLSVATNFVLPKLMDNAPVSMISYWSILSASFFFMLTLFFFAWEYIVKIKRLHEDFKKEVEERFKKEVEERFKKEVEERFKKEVEERFDEDFANMNKAGRKRSLMTLLSTDVNGNDYIPESEREQNFHVIIDRVKETIAKTNESINSAESKLQESINSAESKLRSEYNNEIRTEIGKMRKELAKNMNLMLLSHMIDTKKASVQDFDLHKFLVEERKLLPARLAEFSLNRFQIPRGVIWQGNDFYESNYFISEER